MLEDYAKIRRVIVCCGTVDLRKGINGLAQIVGDTYGHNPFETGCKRQALFYIVR